MTVSPSSLHGGTQPGPERLLMGTTSPSHPRGLLGGTLSSHLSCLFLCVLETSFVSPHAAPLPTPQCKTGLPQPYSPFVGPVGFSVGLWTLLTPAPTARDTEEVRRWDIGAGCVTNAGFSSWVTSLGKICSGIQLSRGWEELVQVLDKKNALP